MVGQKVVGDAADKQAKEMHDAVMEELILAKADREEIKCMHGEVLEILKAGKTPQL